MLVLALCLVFLLFVFVLLSKREHCNVTEKKFSCSSSLDCLSVVNSASSHVSFICISQERFTLLRADSRVRCNRRTHSLYARVRRVNGPLTPFSALTHLVFISHLIPSVIVIVINSTSVTNEPSALSPFCPQNAVESTKLILVHFTHWHSSRLTVDVFGGVCLFVSVFVRTITSERLNIGRSNFAVGYIVQKSRSSSKVKVKGQRSRSPGTKKRKTAESFLLTMHSRACAVARPYASCSNRRYHCVGRPGWRATPVEKSAHAV